MLPPVEWSRCDRLHLGKNADPRCGTVATENNTDPKPDTRHSIMATRYSPQSNGNPTLAKVQWQVVRPLKSATVALTTVNLTDKIYTSLTAHAARTHQQSKFQNLKGPVTSPAAQHYCHR